jgi:hypothetical protein
MTRLLTVGIAALVVVGPVTAQDSQFGIRGLGTPGRFESVRARSTGGAFAAFDGASSLVDAALADITRFTAAAAEYASYRTVDFAGSSSSLRSARFPGLTVAGPVTHGLVMGGGFSTYLNRSYSVSTEDTLSIRGTPEPITDEISSDGAVSDLRLAAALRANPWLTVGAGVHVLTGSSTVRAIRLFQDSAIYHNASESNQESYDGYGVSASLLAAPIAGLRVAAYLRSDSRLRSEIAGFQNAENDLPTTIGGAAQWIATPAVRIAASIAHANWSVSSPGAFNTTNWSVGGEFGRVSLPLRVGVRGGQLPFGPGPGAPSEFAVAAGSGFMFSEGRGIVDFGLERLRRSGGGMTETTWSFLVGITVRP